MKYKVKLKFFEDDATGDWGLAHSNAIDIDTPFNAFWSPQGIFHDVFEHYFEDRHKYFVGKYSFNIGGEVAAMGHYAYYMYNYHLEKRMFGNRGYFQLDEAIIGGTISEMEEAITCGWSNFGSELLCRIPRQKIEDYNLDHIIYEHHAKVKDFIVGKHEELMNDNLEWAKHYKKSVTLTKLKNLYRWGWREAEKIAPRNSENRDTLEEFLEFWGKIVENNTAEHLAEYYHSIEFTITKGEKLSWNAKWLTHEGQEVNGKDPYPQEAIYELYTEEY